MVMVWRWVMGLEIGGEGLARLKLLFPAALDCVVSCRVALCGTV